MILNLMYFLCIIYNNIMILDKLSPLYFILSFAIGVFICYVLEPSKKVVIKFPSPTNSEKVVYVDKQGQCYKYKTDKLDKCPENAENIKPQPVIEDFALINLGKYFKTASKSA
jgi:hypothetical protein